MNRKKDQYQKYLYQKHSKFALDGLVLEKIVCKATGGKPEKVERVIAGEVNEVYSIGVGNDNIIVRISRNGGTRFLSEKWAISKAREMGVPAPEVILVDEFEDKGEKVWVSVENKLQGEPLDKIISSGKVSKDGVKRIIEEAGEILAKIHSVTPQGFGRLDKEGVGDIETREDFMLQPLEPIGIPKEQIDTALRILRENIKVYRGITPHLLHGDYGPKHILVENGVISGKADRQLIG